MKFSKNVLLKIVDIVRNGLVNGVDISEQLRELELRVDKDKNQVDIMFEKESESV